MIRGVRLFHSRLARRILGVFLACAIVPVVCLAVLSYTEVSTLMVDRAGVELARVAKAYASVVHDRLIVAEQELTLIAGRREAPGTGRFTAVWTGDHARDDPRAAALPRVTSEPGAGVPQLVLHVPRNGSPGSLGGRLDGRFVWGDADDIPAGMGICVYDQTGRAVHCTAGSLWSMANVAYFGNS